MQIFKSLRQTLSGSLSFIKKKSKLFLLLILFSPTSAFSLTHEEHKFVKDIKYCLKQIYQTKSNDYIQVDFYIIAAMAVLESDYGRSRFAIEGNNFFGIRTFDLSVPHMKPLGYKNPDFGVIKFKHFCGSVQYTLHTLTNHYAYEDFRKYGNIEDIASWAEDPFYIDKVVQRINILIENNH